MEDSSGDQTASASFRAVWEQHGSELEELAQRLSKEVVPPPDSTAIYYVLETVHKATNDMRRRRTRLYVLSQHVRNIVHDLLEVLLAEEGTATAVREALEQAMLKEGEGSLRYAPVFEIDPTSTDDGWALAITGKPAAC